jgi:hypothetical protein
MLSLRGGPPPPAAAAAAVAAAAAAAPAAEAYHAEGLAALRGPAAVGWGRGARRAGGMRACTSGRGGGEGGG